MAPVATHAGGLFYVWYESTYGYAPPATVDSGAARYLAWQQGIPKYEAALIPYGSIGDPSQFITGLVATPAPPPAVPTPAQTPPPLLPGGPPIGSTITNPLAPVLGPAAPEQAPDAGAASAGKDIGAFEATAYGPPWDATNGTGVTRDGTDLRDSPHVYVIAVDPDVIPLGTKVRIAPNPFGDNTIVFRAADIGGAINGRHVDIYDWRGRQSQLGWGRRTVEVFITQDQLGNTPPVSSDTYFNPLGHANVTPERIDQGVDYAGTGYLVAIADGVVTSVTKTGSGWEGEAYLEYRITQAGPFNGAYVYYAEGVVPVVSKDEKVKGGARVADLAVPMPHGIEIGWAAGSGQESYYRYHDGAYTEGDATRPGVAFSNLIKALGGPPGKIEGPVEGNFPEYMPGGVVPAQITKGTTAGTQLTSGPDYAPAGVTASGFQWPELLYSAFVQIQRGLDNGSHHSNSAADYVAGITYLQKAD